MSPQELALQDKQFEGGAFHPDLENGRASGVVRISSGAIRFESSKGNVELPVAGLKIELGGANDRLIFFSHPGQPQVTIHTADHSILKHPILAQNPALAAQGKRVRTKKRVALAVLLAVIGGLVGAVVLLILSKDRLVNLAASGIPVEWEVKLGDKLFDQMMLTRMKVEDQALETQLKAITDPLVAGIQDGRYPLKFHIIEDPTLNAFAMPGGHVVLHSGLLLAAEKPEEVAGVLAHEIAHVTRRHSIRNVVSSAGLYVILSAFIGDASSLLAVIANNSAFLLNQKFSRDFEREADSVGWNYLVRSDIQPDGMISFFKKMQAKEKELMDKLPVEGVESALAVVSTHPATQERLDTLEAKWKKAAKQTDYRTFQLNYAEFKDSLRAKLHSATKESQNDKEN